jgi:hypothetical protein
MRKSKRAAKVPEPLPGILAAKRLDGVARLRILSMAPGGLALATAPGGRDFSHDARMRFGRFTSKRPLFYHSITIMAKPALISARFPGICGIRPL